ncbi:Aldehyde/histidinol dehydrogenase [Mrakia frigida]|uniref:hexadecenal dehydrogenase n=1 Tax=Mrakia frigida TaxID=29902 RepID=UPI003FCC1A7B
MGIQDEDKINQEADEVYARLQKAFDERICHDVDFRIEQLQKLAWSITNHKEDILQALWDDLGQNAQEAEFTQYSSGLWACTDYISTLKSLSKTQKPRALRLPFPLYKTSVHRLPLGPAFIVGPFNYPWKLALEPFITAVAAGCPAVIKPSEITPQTNKVLRKVIEGTMDPRCYAIIEGEKEVVERLLLHQWGRVFFTGSTRVGRSVAIACAKTFTPCALELGGKCPTIIADDIDINLAAKRTLGYTTMRCSQTCVTSDHVLISPARQQAYVDATLKAIKEWYPDGEMGSSSYGRLPTTAQIDRIDRLLNTTKGRIVRRGEVDREAGKIGISIVCDVMEGDILLEEEVFGPIVVVSTVQSIEEAVRRVNTRASPLGVYIFSKDKKIQDYVMNNTQSGSFMINDCVLQALIDHTPFGGVGESGHGSYHGKWGFDLFTQDRTVIEVPTYLEAVLAARYPPSTPLNRKLLQMLFDPLSLPFPPPGLSRGQWLLWWLKRKSYKAVGVIGVVLAVVGVLKSKGVIGK